MTRSHTIGCALAVTLSVLLTTTAKATLFRETFDTAAVGEVAFEATYPTLDFTQSGVSGAVAVTGAGVLSVDNTSATNAVQEVVIIPSGFADTHRVSALVGAGNSSGNYNVGIRIGGNNVVFHPGLGGGALRVEGANGFGNTNVGFTPANGTLHLLKIDSNPTTGQFDIRLVDGGNPSNVFTASFTNLASVDGAVATRRSGPGSGAGTQTGVYDALTVVSGNTVFFEGFDLNLANATQFANAYPDFVQSIGGGVTLDVSGGVARLAGGTASRFTIGSPTPGPGEFIRVTADIGAMDSNGNFNVGMRIGANDLAFHPGFAGGAFRISGPNGIGNTDMGFVPANGVLHHFQVDIFADGTVELMITDALNPANVFMYSYVDPAAVGGEVGFRREGGDNLNFGLYDNLRIDVLATPTPEPATMATLALGVVGLITRRRRMA